MPRQVKSKTTSSESESASAVPAVPVVAPVVDAAAPVSSEKPKRAPRAKKVDAAPVDAAPATEPAVVHADSVPADVDASPAEGDAPVAEQSIEFLAKLQQLGVLISSLKAEYRTLEKKWSRELKSAQKQSSKRKRKAGNRAPSGFVKPTRISDELAKFLDKPAGCEMARTEVTRDINKYIRTHNLQDKENGRKINPDSKLAALLKLKKSDELTYFNLQRYMSPHFAKAPVKESSA
jgi:upstream activation factor subunit UAF30